MSETPITPVDESLEDVLRTYEQNNLDVLDLGSESDINPALFDEMNAEVQPVMTNTDAESLFTRKEATNTEIPATPEHIARNIAAIGISLTAFRGEAINRCDLAA